VIVRVLRRAGVGLAAVALLAACDDNPLAENRDQGAWFELNPSNVAVNAGGTVTASAVVRNQYGAATNAAVTATPCDGKITAAADTLRSAFEFPERFVITGSSSLGTSCLVVTGGGLTDTIRVRVVPATIRATGADTVSNMVGSGNLVQASVDFLTLAGTAATGFDPVTDIVWTSLTPAQASVDSEGRITGQAPGIGRVLVQLHSRYGVTRTDTLVFRVQAGAFGGTVTTGTIGAATGSIAVANFSEGTIPFDADTQVELRTADGVLVRTFNTVTTGTSRQVVLPFGLPAGNLRYNIINMGPNQIAQTGTISLPTGTPAGDTQEPDNTLAITPKVMAPGEVFFGSLNDTDFRDIIRINVTEAATYTFLAEWNEVSGHASGTPPGTDIDMYVHSSTGALLLERESFDLPRETGPLTLQPGTYFVRLDVYAYIGNPNLASTTYRLTVTKP
jgi:hypothetical protein